jgi:hypothetical protein
MRRLLLVALVLLAACSDGDAGGNGGGPQAAAATVTTVASRPVGWAARWEPELAPYYLASLKLIDAVQKREPFEIISRRIDAVDNSGAALLGAVDRAGPPPAELRAAATRIRSALENEPSLLDQLRGACSLDGHARDPQGCSDGLDAMAVNGVPLMRAVKEIQS